jgi:hypothetical protein
MGDFIFPFLATVGTVLGCINTFVLLNNRRVRLRVVPKSAILGGGGVLTHSMEHMPGATVCIEVVNLSSFPVTISGVGYTLPSRRRASIVKPILLDSKGWPRRLEPREAVTVYGDIADLPRNIGKAFATTDCGVTRLGNSPALDDLKQRLRQLEP